ncbi:MAG: hypothetical protein JXR03_10030 [Cyclobacteriaceae bacterium]
MINYFKQHLLVTLILATSIFISCTDDEMQLNLPSADAEGYFVVNEGGFGKGNTSLSFYDRNTEQVFNDIFFIANGDQPLGDQSQSMTIHGDNGYIVVQNSKKIEVIGKGSLKTVATIEDGIESPRYFVGLSDSKGYVSDWGADGVSGSVKVIDLSNFQVTKTISTGQGTNRLLIEGDKLYAVNAGGWGRDNTLVVINTSTDEISETIEIADNPNSLQVDSNGNIWVLTGGHKEYDPDDFSLIEDMSTSGTLSKISATGEVLLTLSFADLNSPKGLNISTDGSQLYYLYNGGVYAMEITSSALPTEALISKSYYGLTIDPVDGTIIGCEAPSFDSSGNIDIYSAAGTLQSSHQVGIAPNGCAFR